MTYGNTVTAAADAIAKADAILIGAGAGMGVDSGLPDFRGDEGFWKAYPPFREAGRSFVSMANPRGFSHDPELAWGFYGHRLELYRRTTPHAGFGRLLRWAQERRHGAFVFTSNVDGQFQRAGFSDDAIIECHGSIHHLQCTRPCHRAIWSARDEHLDVDESTFRAAPPLPRCRRCGDVSRPNVLMFGDFSWLSERSEAQEQRFSQWTEDLVAQGARLVAVECGAGTAIPSVRMTCESLVDRLDGTLIRINPREAQGPKGTLSLDFGADKALQAIDEALLALE